MKRPHDLIEDAPPLESDAERSPPKQPRRVRFRQEENGSASFGDTEEIEDPNPGEDGIFRRAFRYLMKSLASFAEAINICV